MNACRERESKGYSEWMAASAPPPFSSACTWPCKRGLPEALGATSKLPPTGGQGGGAGVVSKHREEAAVLFFLLTLKSTSPNRHVNRLFRITDQTPTATDTFSPVFVGTSTC